MMEFTVDAMSMSNATTVISEAGQTGTETDASFTASGVTMYATKLSGSILGIPVTFTPSTASAVLLGIANLVTGVVPITMTNVTADQTVILAGQARKTAAQKLEDVRSPLAFLLGKTKLERELRGLSLARDIQPIQAGATVLRGV